MRLISIYTLLVILFLSCSSTKKLQLNQKEQNPQTAIAQNLSLPPIEEETVKNYIKSIDSTINIIQKPLEGEPVSIVSSEDSTRDSNSIKTIHGIWNTLLQKNVNQSGEVNYKSLKKERSVLKEYMHILSTNLPTSQWSTEETKAYWINAYNAFTVKLIIDNYPIKSIKNIKNPWDARLFKLGKKWYNLNEIEHKILRPMGDPRIHFGINCASKSCPPLANKAYTADNIDELLNKQTINFINDPLRNKISARNIKLSKIFSWFAKDFKTEGSIIDFLNTYAAIQIERNAKKSYLSYDWGLNTQ